MHSGSLSNSTLDGLQWTVGCMPPEARPEGRTGSVEPLLEDAKDERRFILEVWAQEGSGFHTELQ